MSLIDAEDFSKVIKDYFHDMITHHKYNVDCVDCNADLQHLLDEQPTAYDVDKVVEELDNRSVFARPVGWSKSYELITLKNAVEVVKQGIASDDVCEWHKVKNGNAYKCNTHAEIHDARVLDWCRCPYCGKRIKVVE